MKVYVLHYSCYEESEVRGVYTEEAMKELMKLENTKYDNKNILESLNQIKDKIKMF